MNRFFIPHLPKNSGTLTLTGEEFHHCTHVMRHGPGDAVVVFDGRGLEVKARIREVTKSEALLDVIHQSTTPSLPYAITLAQAIPKGKCMDSIVQKATEIGAAEIIPLLSERTVVQIGDDKAAGKTDKWTQITVEAAKQCGINWLPKVASPLSPKEFFNQNRKFDLLLIASLQPDSTHFKKILSAHMADNGGKLPGSVLILIGPEGDFTPAEISLAKSHGCLPMTLGPQVLRSETAAIYALSVIAHELQPL
ncbi:16S rRNA (uracil(1498)-N(3))-methyltransferase [Oscillatoria laete-virens NRMC-F 0139]|nr:16S rRNA (uracil(1498)-N(3))-methyltransferase [Oscillatoria laete-virens]MDL5053163.1 16S rRNA (uracil(1498)-N(3))-methyltransferase [Oscillatoria laete-virens NRMC-F 0139]